MDYATINISVKKGVRESVLERLVSESGAQKLFPEETTGRCARLYFIDVAVEDANNVRRKLLKEYDGFLNYVEIARPRKAMR